MTSSTYNCFESILIVDDNELLLSGIKRFCEGEAYRVMTASTAEEALECLRNEHFPFIILDVNLPDMNGCELLVRIKRHSPESMVVIMTSDNSEKLKEDVFSKGAFEFLEKPFAVRSLGAVLLQMKSIRGRIS